MSPGAFIRFEGVDAEITVRFASSRAREDPRRGVCVGIRRVGCGR